MRRKFNIQSLLDPFTLLKLCQVLREIPCGESLEIMVIGGRIPDEIFKIISFKEYEIIEENISTNPERCQIVIQRTKEQSPGPDPSAGNSCCG